MFNIQWGAVGPSRGRRSQVNNPFQEIEMEMSNFRNAAASSVFREDSLMISFNRELENLIDNSVNLMSMLPVIPSATNNRQTRAQAPPRRFPRNRGFEHGEVIETIHNPHGESARLRRHHEHARHNYADRNNHLFPAPQRDRQVWYDPNEPVPDNRLPLIPPRVLTLAQINRIPTKKVSAACSGSCDICLEDFKKGDTKKVLNCKHDYHVSCVDPWLRQHTTCPKCRRQIRAPPERNTRPPRRIPPPCPVRERARAYDQERRARFRNEEASSRQNEEAVIHEVTSTRNRNEEVQDVANLGVENSELETTLPRNNSNTMASEFSSMPENQGQPQCEETSGYINTEQAPELEATLPRNNSNTMASEFSIIQGNQGQPQCEETSGYINTEQAPEAAPAEP